MLINAAGYIGHATEYGATAETSIHKAGATVNIYCSSKMTVEMGHSAMGGDKISDAEASVKALTRGIKLAKKIEAIVK